MEKKWIDKSNVEKKWRNIMVFKPENRGIEVLPYNVKSCKES